MKRITAVLYFKSPSGSLSRFIVFFVCYLIAARVTAQEISRVTFGDSTAAKKGATILTGTITNSETGLPVAGVTIFSDGLFSGQETDAQGKYLLSLSTGRHRLVLRHAAMIPETYLVGLYGMGVLNIQMSPKTIDLAEITISARGAEQSLKQPTTGIVEMTMEQARTIPALMGEADVIKSLQLFPGVTSVGEGSSGVNIRGGRTDQNLTLMNEAIVLNANHAMGFLSSFNADVVKN
ncbi:MAG TPA: carboxypeptidase-like regulatory domain-containing protein, partial [Chryseosolibacter sp.]|nr:carboxypeptidase-like regulatory domain-containing protein [Chryseosolibacter sp.]